MFCISLCNFFLDFSSTSQEECDEFPLISEMNKLKINKSDSDFSDIPSKLKDLDLFHTKLSNKLKSKTSHSYEIGKFLSNKIGKPKLKKQVLSEKTLKRLIDLQIPTFKGIKREKPRRKMTMLKKNIIKNRKKSRPKLNKSDDIDDENAVKEMKLFEIQQQLAEVMSSFSSDKEVITHSRSFRS